MSRSASIVSSIKSLGKVIFIFLQITSFVIICAIRGLFRGQDLSWTLNYRQKLVVRLFRILNIKLTYYGAPPQHPAIYVANHRTYLDPVVMHRYFTFLPVAKSEVGNWPIIGYGAKITGVLYVQRANKESRQATRKAIAQTVQSGHSVVIYPEGTTHIQPQTIEFRMGTFKIAAASGIPVVPVAVDYADPVYAWIGDDTFIPHLLKICRKSQIDVKMAIGQAQHNADPEALRRQCQAWIDHQLSSFGYRESNPEYIR